MTTDGACPAGYTCESGDILICPAGYYCEEGQNKQLCPEKFWTDLEGLESSSECFECTEGFFCDITSQPLSDFATVEANLCPSGSFCATGQSTGSPCGSGYQCPQGSSIYMECEPNSYTGEYKF